GSGTPLDQSSTNHYPDLSSVVALGTDSFVADVTALDPHYFPPAADTPTRITFRTGQSAPFDIPPAALFAAASGGATPSQPGATLASVGAVNGQSGPNDLFETDGSSAFQVSPTALVVGTVFLDDNWNAVRDPGETGLPGVTLTLQDAAGAP